jgi:hypothetical protein
MEWAGSGKPQLLVLTALKQESLLQSLLVRAMVIRTAVPVKVRHFRHKRRANWNVLLPAILEKTATRKCCGMKR